MLHQNWFCKENMIKFYEYYDTELYYDTNTECIYRVEKMDMDIHIIEIHETSDQYESVKKVYDEYKEDQHMETKKENYIWKDLFPNYKDMKPATSQELQLTENITLSLFRAEEDFDAYDLHIDVKEDPDVIFEDHMVRDWVVYDKHKTKEYYGAEEIYVTDKDIYCAYRYADSRFVITRERNEASVLVWFYWEPGDETLFECLRDYVDDFESMDTNEFMRKYNHI